MAMQASVIKMHFIDLGKGATHDFASFLNRQALHADWVTISESNTFVEYSRSDIADMTNNFATENSLTDADREAVDAWIENLPWECNEELSFNFSV